VFAEQEHAVGAFASCGENEAFGVGVGPRALRWDQKWLDAFGGEHCVKGRGELRVAVWVTYWCRVVTIASSNQNAGRGPQLQLADRFPALLGLSK